MARSKTSGHTVTGDAREVWALIQNAKASGIDLASVSVGGCRVELRGSAPPARSGGQDGEPQGRTPRGGIYADFGGEMMSRQRTPGARAADVPPVPGEDFQPALGVDG